MAGSEEELKSLLRRVKEWKSWLKPQHSKSEDHGTQSHHFMANGEKVKAVIVFIFLASKITADGDCSHEIKRHLLLRGKAMTNLDRVLKSRDITLPTKICLSQSYGFSSSHVWIWELDHKEYWAPKNWCFITVMLKILESPLDCKEIKPVNPKENQPWILIERTDPEASILWPPDAKSWLIGRDLDAGKDWRQEEKGITEDEMIR